ncbi:hypothetical protein H4V99_002705 [Cryobacterium sp. CG_9.6]|nr:hypothetical protein [Cryobacterium sp. CG_9.6]
MVLLFYRRAPERRPRSGLLRGTATSAGARLSPRPLSVTATPVTVARSHLSGGGARFP